MKKTVLVSLLFFAAQLSAQTFTPGLWKSKDSLQLNGLQLPDSTGEECITEGQAKDVKTTIENELKKKGCTLTKWSVKNKKLEADLSCKNKKMDAVGKIHGVYTDKSYDLEGEAKGTIKQILPAEAVLKFTGQWVKSCSK